MSVLKVRCIIISTYDRKREGVREIWTGRETSGRELNRAHTQ